MKTLFLAAILAVAIPVSSLGDGVSLTVEGLRNGRGVVLVAVFDNARAFDRLQFENAVDFAEVPARKGTVTHDFPTLTSGPYAVFLFHDENGDEDINHWGDTLLEGIGASGAPNPQDDPGFAQASFPPGPVRVRVHYDQ
jgi:uncharacterized protein (DUF2141 family)